MSLRFLAQPRVSTFLFALIVIVSSVTLRANPPIVTDIQAGEPLSATPVVFSPPVFDAILGITRSPAGTLYVLGKTSSSSFPAQSDSPSFATIPFVARLNSTGTGYDAVQMPSVDNLNAIATDSAGNVYLTGSGAVALPGATMFGSGGGVFVTKLDPSLSHVLWQVFLGGRGDYATGLAVDLAGNVYVTGETDSIDWPVTAGAFQSVNRAGPNGFVTVLAASGSSLLWSTYFGGSQPYAIAIGPKGSVFIAAGPFPATCRSPRGVPDCGGGRGIHFGVQL